MRVRWPDGTEDRVYSPSSVLTRCFRPGEGMAAAEFAARLGAALAAASARVAEVHGAPCPRAARERARIAARAASCPPGDVAVLDFDPDVQHRPLSTGEIG